jgi:hypothetical protein
MSWVYDRVATSRDMRHNNNIKTSGITSHLREVSRTSTRYSKYPLESLAELEHDGSGFIKGNYGELNLPLTPKLNLFSFILIFPLCPVVCPLITHTEAAARHKRSENMRWVFDIVRDGCSVDGWPHMHKGQSDSCIKLPSPAFESALLCLQSLRNEVS